MNVNRHRLRELEALRALVTTGTTVGAAQRLGVSQSAVSRALAQLEARVGRMLFVRRSGRIEATDEALRLNQKLDALFETLAQIDGEEWAQADDEPVRLIVPPTLAHHLMIGRVARFLERHPERRVQLEIQPTDVLISGMLDGRHDLGITSAMIQRTGVHLVPWRRSRIICAMPSGHQLADKASIEPRDLHDVALIGFLRRLGTRVMTERLFARAGIVPRIIAETATNMAAMALVREGLGVALLNPFPVLARDYRGVVARPFEAPVVYQTSFVLPAGLPASAGARQLMRFVKMTTPKDSVSEPL